MEERLDMLEEQMKVMDLRQSMDKRNELYEKRCEYLRKLFNEIGIQYQNEDNQKLVAYLPFADPNSDSADPDARMVVFQKGLEQPVFPLYRLLQTVFQQSGRLDEQSKRIAHLEAKLKKAEDKSKADLEDKPEEKSVLKRIKQMKKKVFGVQSSSFQNKTVW